MTVPAFTRSHSQTAGSRVVHCYVVNRSFRADEILSIHLVLSSSTCMFALSCRPCLEICESKAHSDLRFDDDVVLHSSRTIDSGSHLISRARGTELPQITLWCTGRRDLVLDVKDR
jgi:hypothetical protein